MATEHEISSKATRYSFMLLRAMAPVTRGAIVREIFQQVPGVVEVLQAERLADTFIAAGKRNGLLMVEKCGDEPASIDLTGKGWNHTREFANQ